MKKLIIAAIICSVPLVVWASTTGRLESDASGNLSSNFAPNGKLEVTLTGNPQTINMTGGGQWTAYVTTAGFFRTMSTATRVGIKHTLPANTWTSRAVNKATPFINFTGGPGTLQRQ